MERTHRTSIIQRKKYFYGTSITTQTSIMPQTSTVMERTIIDKVYCQSIKYYDSSHCIIQKKYYYSN